jgi:hypothetical protein
MPFRKLPDHIRKHPDVQDSWHHHHAERIGAMESRLSRTDTGPSDQVGIQRYLLLFVTVVVLTGKITVEQAVQIVGLLLGGGH